MHLPVALAAVSDAAADVLGSQFGRAPVLLPNGVDGARFAPGPRSARPPDAVVEPDPALAPVAPRRLPLLSRMPQRRVCALLRSPWLSWGPVLVNLVHVHTRTSGPFVAFSTCWPPC